MSLFVLSSKDGWVNIMYDGLDAVGINQQPIQNHNPWMLLYFISFLLIVSFFVLNMFVGVVVENFHKCRQHQEAEEARRREEKRLRRLEKKRRKAQRRPYYADYSPTRRSIHSLCTSHYLDLFITFIIGINVITMSMEHYNQPKSLDEALKYCNYVFTIVFVFEAMLKLVAFGFRRFFKDRWNQLDLAIVLLSIMGITLEEIEMNAALPINPTIIRIMRVLRIARVLKLLKMATGMRALLDTVVQALPQVGNLGLLFMLLFFIYAALGVELFGKLDCSEDNPCEGLSRHATFTNFGMAFLTLFRVSTGDNWNGIMKDTLRECAREDKHCLSYLPVISPVYFVTFVLVAQFVLVNVVVAVLMKHLEESNKEAREDAEMDAEIELEMAQSSTAPAAVARGPGPPPSPGSHQAGSPESTLSAKQQALEGTGSSRESRNLLVVHKVAVSRMHSLPNDSYMFRPVVPATAPNTLQEVEMETYPAKAPTGSVTSVHSQPVESCSSLQVPVENASLPAALGPSPSATAEVPRSSQSTPRSPSLSRLLCRQEALRTDSLEGQIADSRDNLTGEPNEKTQPKRGPAGTLGASLMCLSPLSLPGTPPRSPISSPHSRPASVRTRKHTFGQRSIAKRPTGQSGDPSTDPETSDPADEEVSHINSSARSWRPQAEVRGHSASTFTSPVRKASASPSEGHARSSGQDRDLKKFYSVDAQGFLDKPDWADDQRRHSVEVCSSISEGDGIYEESGERKARSSGPTEAEPAPGVRRKKKMSPPCISIDPPTEDEGTPAPRPPVSESSATTLRRRTPSCEVAPTPTASHRDSLEQGESAASGADMSPKGEWRVPAQCRAELLIVPNFSFEPPDTGSPSGGHFLDSGQTMPANSRPDVGDAPIGATTPMELQKTEYFKSSGDPPEKGQELLLTVPKSPQKKSGSLPTTPTTDDQIDEPV